ncbi:MAG: LPS-assembly protein LptD [Thermoanaerobaculia bacterium]
MTSLLLFLMLLGAAPLAAQTAEPAQPPPQPAPQEPPAPTPPPEAAPATPAEAPAVTPPTETPAAATAPVASQLTAPCAGAPSEFLFRFHEKKGGGTVKGKACKQEFVKDDYVILEGEVTIEFRDIKISANKLSANLRTKDVDASGNVVLTQGPRTMSGTRIVYNLDSETGTVFDATGYLDANVSFTGEKIEKIGDQTFRLTDGVFTSCDVNSPSWSFRVGSGVVTLDDYARFRNLSFRARRLPLFWTPYIVWPTKTDRSRGLLIPRVGYSDRLGRYVGMAYYMPYKEWADVTLYGDYYSEDYHAAGTEVRYRPSASIDGKLKMQAVQDPVLDNIEWKYDYRHTQDDLPGGFRGVIDVHDISDLDFFQRFERDFQTSTISNIYSSAYLTKNTPSFSLNIRTDRRKQYLGGDRAETFDQLPGVQFNTYPKRLGPSPVYFSLESSAAYLRTSRGDADYFRGDIYPTLTMQLRTPPWLSIKPQLSARGTYYTQSREPLGTEIINESIFRSYGQAQVETVGPSISRIFDRSIGDFAKFKHVIEPRVRYVHTTDVEEQNQVIYFDTVDSPTLPIVADLVEYSLVQRIIAKGKGENASSREIGSFTLRQSVAVSDPFVEASPGIEEQRFTPITGSVRVNPYSSFTLDATAAYGTVTKQIDQASLSANIRGSASHFGLTWFATFAAPGQLSGNSSQFRVSIGTPIIRDRLRTDFEVNYDAERQELLEQRYLFGYKASCWGVDVELRDFFEYGTQRRVRDYQISINLKNVGTFVDLRGSFGRATGN